MSQPQFPDPTGARELLRPGATAHKAGLSIEERVKALEMGAAGRPGPGVSNGSVITSDTTQTGGVKWQRPPAASIYTAGYTVTTGSVYIQFTTEIFDNAAMVNVASLPAVITVPEAAVYAVSAQVNTQAVAAGGYRYACICINGSLQQPFGEDIELNASTSINTRLTPGCLFSLSAGQQLSVYYEHNSGINHNVMCAMQAVLVSRV
jgi:hypothetical protein